MEWFTNLETPAKVWLIIGAVALLAAIVLCVVFRKKLARTIRTFKSESKRIVWFPWQQTKKSTLLVWVILLISAVIICALDFGLNQAFVNAFK